MYYLSALADLALLELTQHLFLPFAQENLGFQGYLVPPGILDERFHSSSYIIKMDPSMHLSEHLLI